MSLFGSLVRIRPEVSASGAYSPLVTADMEKYRGQFGFVCTNGTESVQILFRDENDKDDTFWHWDRKAFIIIGDNADFDGTLQHQPCIAKLRARFEKKFPEAKGPCKFAIGDRVRVRVCIFADQETRQPGFLRMMKPFRGRSGIINAIDADGDVYITFDSGADEVSETLCWHQSWLEADTSVATVTAKEAGH